MCSLFVNFVNIFVNYTLPCSIYTYAVYPVHITGHICMSVLITFTHGNDGTDVHWLFTGLLGSYIHVSMGRNKMVLFTPPYPDCREPLCWPPPKRTVGTLMQNEYS